MRRARQRPAVAALVLAAGMGGVAHAAPKLPGHAHKATPAPKPLNLALPVAAIDFMQETEAGLNAAYARYTAFKDRLQTDLDVQYSLLVSVSGQWGTPHGGPGVAGIVYAPWLAWTPFTNTALGSGAFTFSFLQNQFWTRANTASQQTALGVLAPPNSWTVNSYQYSQITYTQTLPGNWLALTAGQYSFGQFDGNQYAGNSQTSFMNYALSQNGTQTYANAGTGAYVQISPGATLQLAGGAQSATDITGHALTINGFSSGRIAGFAAVIVSPVYLAGGAYSLLLYDQPGVPMQPGASQGVSFNAVQNLTPAIGLFLRANSASGHAVSIADSIAFGGVLTNPLGLDPLDQAGLGLAWNSANQAFLGPVPRHAEWSGEIFYDFTVCNAMQVTPDVQGIVNPALQRGGNLAAVVTLRTTFKF